MKVAEVAGRYHGNSVDDELVYLGGNMHDDGRSVTHSIRHTGCGADICRKLSCLYELTEIVRCHTGAGLSADEATLLNLPPEDSLPQSLESKIVAHADNLVKGAREITMAERMMLIVDLPHGLKKVLYVSLLKWNFCVNNFPSN